MEERQKPNNIWELTNYIIDSKFLACKYIIEYDISKANISMLYAYKMITKEEYNWYQSLPKQAREVYIGQRIAYEKELTKDSGSYSLMENTIKNGILKAKNDFIEANKIYDIEIVRIANDALAIMKNTQVKHTRFEVKKDRPPIEFRLSFVATSMIKLNKVLVFFNSETGEVTIKGINKNLHQMHTAFLTEICKIVQCLEYNDYKSALIKYHEFYDQYIHYNLSKEYYREFNAGSGYRIKYTGNTLTSSITHGMLFLPDCFNIERLDISYNLNVLRELYGIIISLSK